MHIALPLPTTLISLKKNRFKSYNLLIAQWQHNSSQSRMAHIRFQILSTELLLRYYVYWRVFLFAFTSLTRLEQTRAFPSLLLVLVGEALQTRGLISNGVFCKRVPFHVFRISRWNTGALSTALLAVNTENKEALFLAVVYSLSHLLSYCKMIVNL